MKIVTKPHPPLPPTNSEDGPGGFNSNLLNNQRGITSNTADSSFTITVWAGPNGELKASSNKSVLKIASGAASLITCTLINLTPLIMAVDSVVCTGMVTTTASAGTSYAFPIYDVSITNTGCTFYVLLQNATTSPATTTLGQMVDFAVWIVASNKVSQIVGYIYCDPQASNDPP